MKNTPAIFVKERLHVHVDIEGVDTSGRRLLRVSGTYLSVDKNENAEYLVMDELLVTEDACELFRSIGKGLAKLRKN